MFNDSIVTVDFDYFFPENNNYELVVECESFKYKVPEFEKQMHLATNIWFIINDSCSTNKYVLRTHSDFIIFRKSVSGIPDIYTQALYSIPHYGGKPRKTDKKILKINRKKKKHYIPFW